MLTQQCAALRVLADAQATIIAAAEAARTYECCGALIGQLDGPDGEYVLEAWPLTNRAAHIEREYLITADEVRAIDERAIGRGLEVVGFYHSHPDGTTAPSSTDLDRAWPGYVYAIVDAAGGAIGFWKLAEDRSAFLPLQATLA